MGIISHCFDYTTIVLGIQAFFRFLFYPIYFFVTNILNLSILFNQKAQQKNKSAGKITADLSFNIDIL